MSGWDGYVNAMMKDTGLFDNASILSKESYDEWASTEGFHVSATEAASLLESLTKTTPDDHPALIVVNGIEYQPILVEKNRIYAEMKSNINAGLIVLLGKQCIVVGTYPPSVQPGLAVDSAERLHVYLGEQGF